jgi:hypothetical protein
MRCSAVATIVRRSEISKVKFFPAVLIIAAVCFLWAVSESFPFHSEITVYNLFCTDGLKQGKCDSKEETANLTTYKALVEQQTVIYWQGKKDVPHRLRRCAVRNARNWSCQFGNELEDDPTIKWQMVDGEYSEIVQMPFAMQPMFYPVSKWYWWWIWLCEKTR